MVDTIQVEGNVTGSEAPVEQTQESRPEWLPEKFNYPEDLSKAYGELEKQYTQSRQEAAQTQEATPSDVETPETSEAEGEAAKQAVENAGLDFSSMEEEFAETGTLSEQTYKALQDKGIPKEMVDSYVDGQQARATQYTNELFGFAGGEESYKSMTEWATDNLPDSEIDAFNGAITSGNTSQARLAIDGMVSRYRDNGGYEPSLLSGKASASVDTYDSWAQVTKDMGTAEYKKDPAFRQAVEKKLGRSTF
jgi:hypothetical protein